MLARWPSNLKKTMFSPSCGYTGRHAKPRTQWKTRFYHIALAANVPIILAEINAGKKSVGVDHIIYPSGNIDADMAEIYAFFDYRARRKPKNYASPNKPAAEDR